MERFSSFCPDLIESFNKYISVDQLIFIPLIYTNTPVVKSFSSYRQGAEIVATAHKTLSEDSTVKWAKLPEVKSPTLICAELKHSDVLQSLKL